MHGSAPNPAVLVEEGHIRAKPGVDVSSAADHRNVERSRPGGRRGLTAIQSGGPRTHGARACTRSVWRPPPTRRQRCDAKTFTYRSIVDHAARITIGPGKRGGKPYIPGLCIPVYDEHDYLACGMTEQQFLSDFADLELDDIRACLAFAADRERRLLIVPAA